MSRKTREEKEARLAVERALLKRRRVVLALYLLLTCCAIAGALGPWFEVMVGDDSQGVIEGPKYMEEVKVPLSDAEAQAHPLGSTPIRKYLVRKEKRTLTPSLACVLLGMVIFLVVSGNLAADGDWQVPALLPTITLCVVVGYVVYDVWQNESVLREFGSKLLADHYRGGKTGGEPPTPLMRPKWGGALLVTAAPAMLLVSIYLTFIAKRAGKKKQS